MAQPLCAVLLVRMCSSVESRSKDEGYLLPWRSLCGLPNWNDEGEDLDGLIVGKDTVPPAVVCGSQLNHCERFSCFSFRAASCPGNAPSQHD